MRYKRLAYLNLTVALCTAAGAPSRDFHLRSPDGRFEAICTFAEEPPFKVVDSKTQKALLTMDDERVGNRGLEASWSADSKILVVAVERRVGTELHVCRFVGDRFERTQGPAPPDDFIKIGKWQSSNELLVTADTRSYSLKITPTGSVFESGSGRGADVSSAGSVPAPGASPNAAMRINPATPGTPAASFAYSKFDQAFHANQPAFMRQYGNKPVALRAIAKRFEGDGVLLIGGSVGWETTCYFESSQISKLDKIAGGYHVTVVGRLGESGNTAVLRSCQLVAAQEGDGRSDIEE